MTEPGWYQAEGDPVATQRYWDGGQWIGEPVYEQVSTLDTTPGPPMHPAPAHAPPSPSAVGAGGQNGFVAVPRSAFPGGLKVLTIILSVLKAIPLVIGLLGLAILGALSREFDDESLQDYDDFFVGLVQLAFVILALVILIAGTLLILQLVGAIKERPVMVLIPAAVISAFDVLATISTWNSFFADRSAEFLNPSPGPAVLITIVTVAQVTVVIWAFKAQQAAKT